MATATKEKTESAQQEKLIETADLKPITVSKSAYRDLLNLKKLSEHLGEEYVRFPDSDTKNQSINELFRTKGVLEKRGERGAATYALKVPFDLVVESQRAYKAGPKDPSNSGRKKEQFANTTFRSLPTFDMVAKFIGAVAAESKELSQDRHETLTAQIGEIKTKLAKASEDEEYRLIMELNRLVESRKNLRGELTVEAMKNVAAESEYRSIDWSQVISFDIRQYGVE